MNEREPNKPCRAYRAWESTKGLIEFTSWLPEVVGTADGLLRVGSVPVDLPSEAFQPEVIQEPLRPIDADVTPYRKRLSLFRKRNKNPAKNKSR